MAKSWQKIALIVLPALVVAIVAGCETSPPESEGPSQPDAGGPPFGGPKDVQYAQNLWTTTLRNYRSWKDYPGFEGWQDGKSPHGRFLKYYINETAARNTRSPGYGSIIVKENYMAKDSKTLAAVTIMERKRGYDPDNHDWFWVKYGPDGEIMSNPKGMKLAGRVAKGMPKGCIACHSNAAGNDFLFVND